jgi:hypothetical protein
MPIEIKELHIKVTVEPVAVVNGGDEALRTQFGNNNIYDIDPTRLDGQDALLASAVDTRSGWGISSDPYADTLLL